MKAPYQFGTHEKDKLARLHSKLDHNVLVIASDLVSKQKPLNPQHEQHKSTTRAGIVDLRDVIDMDGWHQTVPFAIEDMQAAPDTSLDENGNPGNATGYQWYGLIEAACCQLRGAPVAWRDLNQEID